MTEPTIKPTEAANPQLSTAWPAASDAAASFVPASALIGITGAVIGQGHDALALSLGLAGAAFLWAAGLLPARDSDGRGLPAYLASRYESPVLGFIGAAILAAAFLTLLTAELTALSGAVAAFAPGLSVPPLAAVTVLLLAAGFVQLAAKRSAAPFTTVALPAALLALLVSLAALSSDDGPGVLVSVPTLADIGLYERALLEKRLADPSVFKPFASPFLRTDVLNMLATISCLSLGIAILAAARRGSSARPENAGRLRAGATTLAIAALVLIPALAAAGRRTLLAAVDGGVKATAVPDWMTSLAKGSALQVCGAPQVADAAAIAKACGKGVGAQGLMRWHDFVFAPDGVLMAALESQAGTILATVAGVFVLVAAIFAAMASVRAAALSLMANEPGETPEPGALLAVTVAGWLIAAGFVALNPAPSATLLVWSATLAAAGLAPALMMASLVSSPSRQAALIAAPLGAGAALGLILVTRYDAMDALLFTTDYAPLSPPALRKLTNLMIALGNAKDDAARAAPILAQVQDLARDNISWLGLKPLAAGAWGLAIGAVVMVAGQAAATLARSVKRT